MWTRCQGGVAKGRGCGGNGRLVSTAGQSFVFGNHLGLVGVLWLSEDTSTRNCVCVLQARVSRTIGQNSGVLAGCRPLSRMLMA